MDLEMAPPDGIAATREIRASYPNVEVVILTSFGDEARVRAALEVGAAGYLLKDAEADEVAAAIRAAHRGELQLDPAIARLLMPRQDEPSVSDPAAAMTARELDVLRVVGAGKANKEIAVQLGISERTRTHVSNILSKLGLHSRTQAALWAVREGLVETDQRRDEADAR
jgi:DNA-binding NarL/FixJ family response regulator